MLILWNENTRTVTLSLSQSYTVSSIDYWEMTRTETGETLGPGQVQVTPPSDHYIMELMAQ